MILITGGARSGKSALAEKLAAQLAGESGREVVYIATAEAGDGEMRARIDEHRRRRPEGWATLEAPVDLPGAIEQALADDRTILVDCLTVYISNLMHARGLSNDSNKGLSDEACGDGVDKELERLVDACRSGNGHLIIVSNEVGMGIVPGNRLAREFRDAAGRANQKLAALADEVYMCISGIPMKVK
jgi:adenosylcobinamide kinase/adenosylcobinamide-phosphate guanylyltransferase